MKLSLIVAMDRNRVIGRSGTLPWRLSADLKRFKTLTMGHHLIMGRKTFDSLPRLLPGRTSVVISRQETGDRGQQTPGSGCLLFAVSCPLLYVTTLEAALRLAATDSEVFIIGGAQIYELALPQAGRLYVTHVEAELEGDTYFPPLDWSQWRLLEETRHEADTKNEFPHRFCIYDRISA